MLFLTACMHDPSIDRLMGKYCSYTFIFLDGARNEKCLNDLVLKYSRVQTVICFLYDECSWTWREFCNHIISKFQRFYFRQHVRLTQIKIDF